MKSLFFRKFFFRYLVRIRSFVKISYVFGDAKMSHQRYSRFHALHIYLKNTKSIRQSIGMARSVFFHFLIGINDPGDVCCSVRSPQLVLSATLEFFRHGGSKDLEKTLHLHRKDYNNDDINWRHEE